MRNLESLSPWQSNTLFEEVTHRLVTSSGSAWVQLAPANPRRVAICFTNSSSANNLIFGIASANVGGNQPGFIMGSGQAGNPGNLWFYHYRHGPLVAKEWFVGPTAGTFIICVTEIVLREWPTCHGS